MLAQINARELCKLAGETVPSGSEESSSIPLSTIESAASKFSSAHTAVDYIATTDGPYEATLVNVKAGRVWRFSRPVLSRPVVNPIGAGDAVASGTTCAWSGHFTTGGLRAEEYAGLSSEDAEALDAFRWGLACGAASCLHVENSKVDLLDAISLYKAFIINTSRQ